MKVTLAAGGLTETGSPKSIVIFRTIRGAPGPPSGICCRDYFGMM